MSHHDHPFVLEREEYKRDIDPIRQYIDNAATFINKQRNVDYETAKEYVVRNLKPGGRFPFKDPTAYYLERNEVGDREKKSSGLYQYIMQAVRERAIIMATFTIYDNPEVNKSYLVDFIDDNVARRGVAKKAMFKAAMARDAAEKRGDSEAYESNRLLHNLMKGEQGNRKISNNSISGAHAQSGTPLFNPTAHSSLTSTCRSTSGYGNANNEKVITGNRHYWSMNIVLNNITSTIKLVDMDQFKVMMTVFGLRAPTVKETMECITYSTNLYWRDARKLKFIEEYVSMLTDTERAAFVYVGDLYHTAKYNDAVVRRLLDKLAQRVDAPCDDHAAFVADHPEEYRNLALLLCPEETRGVDYKDLVKMDQHRIVGSTVANISNTLEEYRLFFKMLFLTPVVPASLALLPTSIRRCALTSDTDSTIFTVQDWCQWHNGYIGIDQKSNATADVMVFIASMSIIHVLARMSANFGIEQKRLFQIAMKNEFKFDVFIPTQVAKHYFAFISSQEGNIYNKYKAEIKGVHLKSSNVPKKIMKKATNLMLEILTTVSSNKKIKLIPILKDIADLERTIVKSVTTGEVEKVVKEETDLVKEIEFVNTRPDDEDDFQPVFSDEELEEGDEEDLDEEVSDEEVEKRAYEYFRIGQIKGADSYTKPEMESNYWYYLFWEATFGQKYGSTQPPPYTGVKISIGLNSATKYKRWLEQMEDRALATRIEAFMKKSNRNKLTTIWLPEQVILSSGIPTELMTQIDTRKIVIGLTQVFYLILECLGVYMLNSKKTRLCMDYY